MANPQREKGNVQIANDLFDALCRADLSGAEFRVVLAIYRRTYGYRKKQETVKLSQLMVLTGIGDKGYLSRITSALASRKIILKIGKSGAPCEYGPQKDYDQWVDRATVDGESRVDAASTVPNSCSTVDGASVLTERQGLTERQPTVVENYNGSAPTQLHVQTTCTDIMPEESGCPYCRKHSPNPDLQLWHDLYLEIKGMCPTIKPGRDGKTLKDLHSAGRSPEEVQSAIRAYLNHHDPWIVQQGHALDILGKRFDAYRNGVPAIPSRKQSERTPAY